MMRSECCCPHKSTSSSRVRRRSPRCTAITTGRNTFPRVRPIARIPRLGVAAATVSRVWRHADLPAAPDAGVAADGYAPRRATFDQACRARAGGRTADCAAALGDMLRHALGLSAWKRFGSSRWSLRVNPSSGNLHPTEAYVICGALPGVADQPAVYHYAADRHALELRCVFDEAAWRDAFGGRRDILLVALTSIHWREAWKYGERAFRYCQHDLGHAIAAVSIAAALVGWRAALLPAWSHARSRR